MIPTLLLALSLQGTVTTKVAAALWEYPDAIADQMVFVVSVDGGAAVTLTPADVRVATDPQAPTGDSTYAYPLPPLTIDQHAVTVTACAKANPTICAPTQTVSFQLIVAPVPVVGLRAR